MSLRETSLKTIASTALRSSFARARSIASAPCSAAKPTSDLIGAATRRGPGEDVLGRLEPQLEARRSPSRAIFACAWLGGAEVGRRGGHQQHVRPRRTRSPPPRRARPRSRRRSPRTPPGVGSDDVGGDQGDLGPAPGRGLGQREPHAAAGAVADEAHRVDRLAGAAGGDQDAQAVPGPVRARQRGLDLRQQARRGPAGARPRTRRATRARPRRARSPATPRSRRVARFAWVAASAYMRSFIAGATSARGRAGEEGGGQHRVADAGGELGERVRRRRRDEVGVGVRRPARGGRSGRGREPVRPGRRRASGRARTRRSSTGAPTMPSNEAAPTKRSAVGVISTRTPCPALVARRASSSAL